MMFTEDIDDYSSLPQADNNRALQEMSLRAFRQMLSASEWVVRDERIEDAGVDASLELLINARFTNQRAQVQLKSTQHPQDNRDGSVSLSVPVSNLKYLLNGESPLYVLYIEPRQELRYAWARDERQRLDKEAPTWQEQENITIRFYNPLSSDSLSAIRSRINRESRLKYQIHDILGKATAGDTVHICIDPETLRSSDPQRLLELILEQGISLVNAGRGTEIIEAKDALNSTDARLPRVQLVYGYALYLQGQFASAIAAFTQAFLARSQLSEQDQQFLSLLRDSCDYHTGRLSFDEFAERQAQWKEDLSHTLGITIQLDELRHTLLSQTDGQARREFVSHIHQEVSRIMQTPSISTVLKCQAYIFVLYAQASQIALDDMERWSKVGMRHRMHQPVDISAVMAASSQAWDQWDIALEQAFVVAKSLNHPLLLADLHYNRANAAMMNLQNKKLLVNLFSQPDPPEESQRIAPLVEETQKALNYYEQLGQLEGQLQAKLLTAQLLIFEGKIVEARSIASEVLPIAQAMQYPMVQGHAQQIIDGQTVIEKSYARAQETLSVDEDFRFAEESDERMHQFAVDQLANLDLPVERLPILERALLGNRHIARQRLSWCQHIAIIEDLSHTQHPSTLYRSDPKQFGQCSKLGYRSLIGHTNWETIIEAFKQTYCDGCPQRQPKI